MYFKIDKISLQIYRPIYSILYKETLYRIYTDREKPAFVHVFRTDRLLIIIKKNILQDNLKDNSFNWFYVLFINTCAYGQPLTFSCALQRAFHNALFYGLQQLRRHERNLS